MIQVDWSKSRSACPACDRGGKDDALGITRNDDGSLIAHCFRCGYVERLSNDDGRVIHAGRPRPAKRHETLSDYGSKLWNECIGLRGTAGEDYLLARGCVIPPADGDLKYHPALKHSPSGDIGPALVALVTDAVTREPLTLHRTWIRADGNKADVDRPRMLLAGHRKEGGVVRLWGDEAVTLGLGIAEGIESALSLAHAFQPVWCAVDAGNLGKFPVLAGVESLTIAADGDPAGIVAAKKCATRWFKAGREVFMVEADEGEDVNDLVRAA